jgi:hypothetical protein
VRKNEGDEKRDRKKKKKEREKERKGEILIKNQCYS